MVLLHTPKRHFCTKNIFENSKKILVSCVQLTDLYVSLKSSERNSSYHCICILFIKGSHVCSFFNLEVLFTNFVPFLFGDVWSIWAKIIISFWIYLFDLSSGNWLNVNKSLLVAQHLLTCFPQIRGSMKERCKTKLLK